MAGLGMVPVADKLTEIIHHSENESDKIMAKIAGNGILCKESWTHASSKDIFI